MSPPARRRHLHRGDFEGRAESLVPTARSRSHGRAVARASSSWTDISRGRCDRRGSSHHRERRTRDLATGPTTARRSRAMAPTRRTSASAIRWSACGPCRPRRTAAAAHRAIRPWRGPPSASSRSRRGRSGRPITRASRSSRATAETRTSSARRSPTARRASSSAGSARSDTRARWRGPASHSRRATSPRRPTCSSWPGTAAESGGLDAAQQGSSRAARSGHPASGAPSRARTAARSMAGSFCRANAAEPSPLLLDIHGGPASFSGNLFSLSYFYRYVLASRGWAILTLNPTGSGSYGRDFAHGIRAKWGEHDLAEQLAAVDQLVARGRRGSGSARRDRLLVRRLHDELDDRAHRPVQGRRRRRAGRESGVVPGTEPHRNVVRSVGDGREHHRRPRQFRRLSPINYVDKVTTPTLVLHGRSDERCPIGQGEELFAGLVAAGKVPTEFVRYPGGSHMFIAQGRPSHRVDFNSTCRRLGRRGTPRAISARVAPIG